MKRLLGSLIIVCLVWCVMLTGSAVGQATKSSAADDTAKKSAASQRTNFSGEVTAVSASSITVKTLKGDKTAALTEKTKVTGAQGGQKVTDVKVGDQVRVYASNDGAGNWRATTVRVLPSKKKT